MASTAEAELLALLNEQRTLEAQLHDLGGNAGHVLAAGAALLEFASREERAFATMAALLDPVVRNELAGEHEQFAEDLELLAWLVGTSPDSPDVPVLTTSLVRRMRQHVERDGRLLARAATFARAV